MSIELDTFQLENKRLRERLLRTNPLVRSIFHLQEMTGKERFNKKAYRTLGMARLGRYYQSILS